MHLALPTGFVGRLFGPAPVRARITRRFAAQVREGDTRVIEAPPGDVTVHCREGHAWITHDGDPRDVLLQADESYAAGARNRMSVHAFEDCIVEFEVAD